MMIATVKWKSGTFKAKVPDGGDLSAEIDMEALEETKRFHKGARVRVLPAEILSVAEVADDGGSDAVDQG